MPSPGMYGRLGKVPRRTKSNRTVRPPTQATSGAAAEDSRTYSWNAGGGNPAHSWLIPANVVSGDLIFVSVLLFTSSGSGLAVDATPPSGYTSLVDLEETGNGVQEGHYYIWYKVADGTEVDTTFTTGEDCYVAFLSWRVASAGVTLGTPVASNASSDTGASDGEIDLNPVTPGTAGDYVVQTVTMHNNGNADPDNASAPASPYAFVDYVTSETVARRPRIYVAQATVAIATNEDPGNLGWDSTVEFTLARSWTVATRIDTGDPAVASGDHTHTGLVTGGDSHDHAGGDGAQVDHGLLGGLADDDHTLYVKADGTRAFTGEVAGVTPTVAASLATKGYVDGVAGVSDHGALTGLADDDHTQYSLAAGTRAFTGTVSGVTPTADAHLATKGYVDANAGSGEILISDTPSTPLVFADLLQNEAQDDLIYAD